MILVPSFSLYRTFVFLLYFLAIFIYFLLETKFISKLFYWWSCHFPKSVGFCWNEGHRIRYQSYLIPVYFLLACVWVSRKLCRTSHGPWKQKSQRNPTPIFISYRWEQCFLCVADEKDFGNPSSIIVSWIGSWAIWPWHSLPLFWRAKLLLSAIHKSGVGRKWG